MSMPPPRRSSEGYEGIARREGRFHTLSTKSKKAHLLSKQRTPELRILSTANNIYYSKLLRYRNAIAKPTQGGGFLRFFSFDI